MADYDSSLPVRSESDGTDERLHVKIVDGVTSPAVNQTAVDSDNNLHIEAHANKPNGDDVVMRLSELGAVNGDGDYDGTNNTKPSSTGLIAHDRGASIDETSQNKRPTAVAGDSNKVALDVAISDSSGNAFSASNPLPVVMEESGGTEICDYDIATAVAKDATDNHDYSVADTNTFRLRKIYASASGKMKMEVQIGDGAATEVFTTKFVGFNSTANPQIEFDLDGLPISVLGTTNTTTIRVIRTNLDNSAQDLYSTIIGANFV